MMVMTAKVDLKKTALILGAIAAGIIGIILLFGGSNAQSTSAPAASNNDARVKFLQSFGWDVVNSPVESSQIRIPETATEVFDRYNQLQKANGYDLSKLAGKNAMRYVYKINNYPGATEPVYATLLIYKNQVIGGDITNTAANGTMQALTKAKVPAPLSNKNLSNRSMVPPFYPNPRVNKL